MAGTTSTKLATFEEFEGLEELTTDQTREVNGGAGHVFFIVVGTILKVVRLDESLKAIDAAGDAQAYEDLDTYYAGTWGMG